MSAPNWWGDWRPTLTPHTGNLQATDLIECTSIIGGLPVNTAITGAQIIAAASGGATWGSITGTLSSQTDLQSALNAKQDTLVSGTNIKTINGNSILGSGNLTISGSNIYNADGTLTAARTLTQGGFDLTIAGTTSSRFFSNGNVGIGTTTNAGFKLNVNGTAKVQSGIAIGGGTIDAIRLFDLQVASSSDLLHRFWNSGTGGAKMRFVSNDGTNAQHQWTSATYWLAAISVNSSIGMDFRIGLNATEAALDASTRMRIFTNGNIAIGTTTDSGYKLDVAGTTRMQSKLSVGTPTSASAVMEITSTTQGFLPPRMTNAQMLAIITPAAGLVVYDTTNNKHCGYNGTAWQNFY